MKRAFLIIVLVSAAAGCGEKTKKPAFGRLATVEVLGLDDSQKLTYRVNNRKFFITWLKVRFTITVDGTDYQVEDEPLGPEEAPSASIAPGARQEFSVTAVSPGEGVVKYRITAEVVDFRWKASAPGKTP